MSMGGGVGGYGGGKKCRGGGAIVRGEGAARVKARRWRAKGELMDCLTFTLFRSRDKKCGMSSRCFLPDNDFMISWCIG
jgi:hypothetical protein